MDWGEGFRSIDRLTRVDRKTVRRYVEAAVAVGVTRDGGQGQLSDEMLGAVIVAARPVRPDGDGEGWAALAERSWPMRSHTARSTRPRMPVAWSG